MILYVSGNLFQSPAQVLVNTVNTVGVMGRGVAMEFKRLYPDMFERYQQLCDAGRIDIGKLWLYKSPNKYVLNFPTKRHWRNPSRVEYIVEGLETFRRNYAEWGIHSIAFPPLGCGNGRLDFETQVRPIMHRYLAPLPIEVFIYPTTRDDFVAEHEQPDAMTQGLSTEPRTLPFSEVWDDILATLKQGTEFRTLIRERPFRIEVAEDGDRLVITPTGQTRYHIAREALLGFWQQLRDHGFSMRSTVPGISPSLFYYLIPLFARLSYVKPVTVSERYDLLDNRPVRGLQILPSAFKRGTLKQRRLFQIT